MSSLKNPEKMLNLELLTLCVTERLALFQMGVTRIPRVLARSDIRSWVVC